MVRHRSRSWLRIRASLVTVVATLVAILSLVASSTRAPVETSIGIALARAAEVTGTSHPRPRLRTDREDARVEESRAVLSSDATKMPAPRTERPHANAGVLAAAKPVRRASLVREDAYPGAPPAPLDSPTRGRARLMVFLN